MENDQRDSTGPAYIAELLREMSNLPQFSGMILTGVHDMNSLGTTPLHIAAIRGDVRAIRALLLAGAEIDARGEHGYTPLHEAVEQGHYEAARCLLDQGSSLIIANDDGLTAAELAAVIGETRITELFKRAE